MGLGSGWCSAAAPYLGVACGKAYFELEILDAGSLLLGVAGSAFMGRPWRESEDEFYTPGFDGESWGVWAWNGKAYHRCWRVRGAANLGDGQQLRLECIIGTG